MTDHERTEIIAEARIFALAAPVILPLVEKRKREALGRLMQAHKAGRSDVMTLVAEISVLTDLENEINIKETTYRSLEEQHARPTTRK